MTYDQFEKAEPALVSGLFTGSAGFLALLAANFGTVHSAGLAVGMSASQTLLTRPAVYSPRSVRQITGAGGGPPSIPADLFQAGSGFARPDEPAATIGVLIFLAGFLVQLFSGVEMVPALATAAGIAGVQTVATRSRAYSPAMTQILAALSNARPSPDETGEPADPDQGKGDDKGGPGVGLATASEMRSWLTFAYEVWENSRRGRSQQEQEPGNVERVTAEGPEAAGSG
jgi:hypothetical protein